ncbi:MAG: SUMF1/EgtB/PvdO family nonheme iron enzyme [Anaerolineaceae bacterium]|nr:SUMF1/EgtB/PvdO family nonheme iron enzyme [Anaerolineaceae bacterium]
MTHIFISYSHEDQDYVTQLANDLCQHGFDVWMDGRINYGNRWWRTIEDALKSCAAFVIVMSPNSEKSEWVEREILLAKREEKPILPLLLEGKEFALLITTQYVNVIGNKLPDDDFYEQLKQVITPAPESGTLITPSQKPWWSEPKYFVPILVAVIAGIFGLWQGVFANNGGNTPTPPTIAIAEGHTATLSSFQQLQTAEAQATQTAEAKDAFILTQTGLALLNTLATATAEYIAPTETAAHATLVALSFTPTPTPSLTPTATPVISNVDWTPYEREFDSVTMVLVPVGCFMMGSNDGDRDEQPVEEQCFDKPFWIDKYEVTNAQYGSVGCAETSVASNKPRNCVNWFEARNFCETREARLPTEAEWEYAARGPDDLVYPWGSEWDLNKAIQNRSVETGTSIVGLRPGGKSWVGALDMIGNVWEWVSSPYTIYPYSASLENNADSISLHVLRGGSFINTSSRLRASSRVGIDPNSASMEIGFRCARDFEG